MTQAAFDFSEPPTLRRVQSPAVGKSHRKAKTAEKEAAKAVVPRSGTQRFTILEEVARVGNFGRTQWELVKATGILRSSVCARVKELEEGGWVRAGRATRRSGRLETVYFATTRGIKAVRQPSPSSRLKDQPAPEGVKAQLTNPRQGCPAALPPSGGA